MTKPIKGDGEESIPSPRSPLDDAPVLDHSEHESVIDEGPENGLIEPDFRHEQTWARGKRRRYNGYVERVGGAEGKRIRDNLTATVRDLLDWAARHNGTHDREVGSESKKDHRRDAA